MMSEHYDDSRLDYEEAFYWWSINDVCDLIRQYGYSKVMMDIDKSLKNDDLVVEYRKIEGDEE
jgi:hypothetical protein